MKAIQILIVINTIRWGFVSTSNLEHVDGELVTECILILVKKLLEARRMEQIEAMRNMRRFEKYEKQYQLIKALTDQVFKALQSGQTKFQSLQINFILKDDKLRNEYLYMFENIALMSEFILRFPNITQNILRVDSRWNPLLRWAYEFANTHQQLLDKSTSELLYLVYQELGLIERTKEYVNPYVVDDNSHHEKKKKTKSKRQRGPRLSMDEL